jgi:phosphoribosyl 1,2-cyclic phosphate phosphodiesterase
MRATILGCGGAGGVPLIGNFWGDCDPAEPKNRRTRVSLLVEEGAREEGATFFSTLPDMREQFWRR